MEDLASFCFEKTGRGEEMQCLQDNMERLSPDCKVQVSNYTEEESEHVELNPFITAYCSRFLETHCQVRIQLSYCFLNRGLKHSFFFHHLG